MKTTCKLYKYALALLLAVMGGMSAWGQTEGDKYESVGSSSFRPSYVDCSSYGSDGDWWETTYYLGSNAVDDDEDTYWESDEGNNNDLATITLRTNGRSFNAITIRSASNSNNCPVSVKIESSDNGNGGWTNVKDQGLSRNNREVTIDLPASINAEYIRLSFERYKSGWYMPTYYEIQIYDIAFQGESNIPTIQHKPAKWHAKRTGNYVDDFSDDKEMFTEDDYDASYGLSWPSGSDWQGIQAAHTTVDTIYVEKGTSIELALPDRSGGIGETDEVHSRTNIGSYQRWYNFRTEKTFVLDDAYSGNSRVYDLLTPASGTYYRFTNGYVNRPLVDWNSHLPARMNFYYPDDTEFQSYNPDGQSNNDFYLVACDLSGYTDFSENGTVQDFEEGGYYEPTLTHRVIYYLVGVESDRTLPSEPDVYEIDFPAYTYPNKSNELVALPMDARSYYAGTGASQLKVTLSDNTAGISLLQNNAEEFSLNPSTATSITLDGDDRSIFFRMPNRNNDGSRYVNGLDGNTEPTATINVGVTVGSNTTTVLQFKLTFRNESRLLTQTMVNRLDAQQNINGTTWSGLRYRTPDSLKRANILLTELNFDYETSIAQGVGGRFYPYPLAWESNSYGFYDGTNNSGFIGGGAQNYYYPEYGSYSLLRSTNGYIEHKDGTRQWGWGINGGNIDGAIPSLLENSDGNNSTYHLFVDASDRPGLIARLPFEEDLCAGSVLYVSAWVKTARWDNTSANAAVLFTIMGVDADGNYTPIYRHQTGQIPATYSDNSHANDVMNDFDLTIPGLSDNEWLQTYFSFVNPSNQTFERYILQIDNNSPSTQGGDIYLDDIRVYISRPMAEVTQLQMACTDSRTLMNLKIDWDRFCQRVDVSGSDGYGDLGICFVDTLIFHNTYKETNSLKDALNAAVVELGQDETNSRKFRMLHYHNTFGAHEKYTAPGTHVAADNEYYFYALTEEGGSEYLSVDFYGDMVPNRAYWVVMVAGEIAADEETSEITDTDIFTYFYTDPCALVADFKVQGDAIIKVNGEIVTPETEFCRGNVHNFTVDLRVPVGDDYVTVTEGIYYDWFFGTTNDPLTEYQAVNETYSVSLQEALRVFRNIYPDAANLDGVKYGDGVQDDTGTAFTEGMFNIINYYLTTDGPAEGQNRPLVLRQPSLSITLLEALRVVICPIPTKVPPEGLGLTEAEWEAANICWGYTYLELTTTSDAPTLHAGFNTTSYPEEGYDPALRIGLEQIKSVSGNNNNVLTLNLRGAKSYDPDNKESATLRRVRAGNGSEVDEQYAKIYLTRSTDPAMQDWLSSPNYHQLALPIGTLNRLEAHYYKSGSTEARNDMEIQFDLSAQTIQWGEGFTTFTFDPKEGYEYTFSVYYEEMVEGTEDIGTACIGTFPVTMKVVPEYLVWNDQQKTDTRIGNWNNDGNWKRATNDDINATNTITEYEDGDNRAFVPMLFSKVIMPRDSKALLYAAGLQENGNSDKWVSNRPEYVAEPTDSIQYDLMAYEQNDVLTTKPYRVALCDQIHFEPGAEMLHAEYLLYNKAWVDYELEKGRWYTLASPLQGVVAGDFYAPTSGRQETEYFQPITFGDDYNRFNPSVYQRGWKNDATEVNLYTEGSNYKNVAIAGNWSSLYNNVAEPYAAGTGFSLKVQDITDGSKALFRLTKADESYSYYNKDEETGGNSTPINRTDENGNDVSGRLKSDDIYHRTETNASYNGTVNHDEITVELSESANGEYYLVGNPFMAHLDMGEFLTRNNGVLEPKYWYVADNGVQNVVVTDPDGTDWTNSDDASFIPPMRSFFVKKSESAGEKNEIVFTHEMQALGGASVSGNETNALIISATSSSGRTSRAAVAYDGAASAEYVSGEDAELFLDSNLGDVPMVYTVAGTMATSINRTSQLTDIPVGLYGTQGETVTLAFEGLDSFSGATLYDAQEGTETLLYDGRTATVPARTSGRYFLRLGAATDNKTISARKAILIYTVGRNRVVVSSDGEPLQTVRVYNMAGSLVRQERVGGMQYEFTLPAGIYIVSAEDRNGMLENVKVRVD